MHEKNSNWNFAARKEPNSYREIRDWLSKKVNKKIDSWERSDSEAKIQMTELWIEFFF